MTIDVDWDVNHQNNVHVSGLSRVRVNNDKYGERFEQFIAVCKETIISWDD